MNENDDLPPETKEEKREWQRILDMDDLEITTELEVQGVDVEAFLDKIAKHIPGFKRRPSKPRQINSRS